MLRLSIVMMSSRPLLLAAVLAAACRAGPPGAAPAPAPAQSAAILSDAPTAWRPPVAPVQPLADPALAVTKRAPGGDWPIGTGGHWVSETDATGALTAVPVRRGPLAVLRVSSVPAGRTRDALDEGSDLVITDDPAVLEDAGTRPGDVDVALHWNRTYVLLAPGHPEGLADIKRGRR